MEDKWSFVFVHEILPQGCLISYWSCAVGTPSPLLWDVTLGNVDPSLAERRPFQWPCQQLHHLEAELVLSSSGPWLLEKLWHCVHLLLAPDGWVDHKTLSKNTVYMSLLGGHFNPPFISLPFWSSRPLTHKLGRRSVPGKAAFRHGFCFFNFFNRLFQNWVL